MQITSIVEEIKTRIRQLAEQNNFDWFYKLHQVEIVRAAEDLLVYYPNANRDVIILACWLHDIMHYTAKTPEEIMQVKTNHHIDGAVKARQILPEFMLPDDMIEQVAKCIERHRNRDDHTAETIEEKIVAAADSLSHFKSIFYFTYFKVHPYDSLEQMVEADLQKLERDWRDLEILPEAAKLAETRYQVIKGMLEDFNPNA